MEIQKDQWELRDEWLAEHEGQKVSEIDWSKTPDFLDTWPMIDADSCLTGEWYHPEHYGEAALVDVRDGEIVFGEEFAIDASYFRELRDEWLTEHIGYSVTDIGWDDLPEYLDSSKFTESTESTEVPFIDADCCLTGNWYSSVRFCNAVLVDVIDGRIVPGDTFAIHSKSFEKYNLYFLDCDFHQWALESWALMEPKERTLESLAGPTISPTPEQVEAIVKAIDRQFVGEEENSIEL